MEAASDGIHCLQQVVYGLETIQLTRREQDQIDALQLKMFRRVLNISPTDIDRSWTNQRVVDTLWKCNNSSTSNYQLNGSRKSLPY